VKIYFCAIIKIIKFTQDIKKMTKIPLTHNAQTMTRRLSMDYCLTYLEGESFESKDLFEAAQDYLAKGKSLKKESCIFVLNHLPNSYTALEIIGIIANGGIKYEQLPNNLKENTQFAFSAGYYDPMQVKDRLDILNERMYAEELIVKEPQIYNYLPEKFKNDKIFILKALSKNTSILELIKDKIDDDYALCAIKYARVGHVEQRWNILSQELKNNDNFIIDVLKEKPEVYQLL
jgi:hypothetical protein